MEDKKSKIKLGAQNCFYELKGAYTGAVSAPMLKSVGCDYALVGHSERRKIFSERDSDINHALERVQESGITPILCIGETKEEVSGLPSPRLKCSTVVEYQQIIINRKRMVDCDYLLYHK